MKWENGEKKPPYNTPLIIVVGGVVQHITYVFDESDTEMWFESYFFDEPDACIPWNEVTHWMPLPEPPEVDNNGQH